MTPTKILIGQAVVTISTITGTLWASTQWVAYRLGYQTGLGEHWFDVVGLPVYHPW